MSITFLNPSKNYFMLIRTKIILPGALIVIISISVVYIFYIGIKLNFGEIIFSEKPSIYSEDIFLGANGVVLQKENNDCGPAALMNIFIYYGIESTLEEIKAIIETKEQGSSMFGLKEMAELKGLKAEGWKYSWIDFQQVVLPVIAFVRENHYVVVELISNDGSLIIVDPAYGRIKISQKKFKKIWNGETLQIEKADSGESAFLEKTISTTVSEISTDSLTQNGGKLVHIGLISHQN